MFKIIEIGTGYSSIPTKVGAATEVVIEELSKSFIKKGYHVSIVDLKESHSYMNHIKFYEIKIPYFLKGTTHNLGIIHRVKRVIYSLQIAALFNKLDLTQKYIFHFHNQYNYFFFDKLIKKSIRANIKTIYTLHSYIWSQNWNEIEKVVFKKYFLEIYSLKNVDIILALNENAKNNLIHHLGISESKIILIPNGVNNEVYSPIKERSTISALKIKHNILNEKTLLHVGSICPRKNQLNIIKELTYFIKKHDLKFLYAGGIIDQKYFHDIQQYIKTENIQKNVIYLGEVSPGKKLNQYYNLADAFIFHSTSEAFGLVPLEALAAGKPVFLSENLKNRFFPKTSSNGIIYFNNKNIQQVIKKYLFNKQLLTTFSKKAIEYISSNFAWDAVADIHLDIFNNISNNKSISEEKLKWKQR